MPQLTFAAQGQSRGTGNGADEVLIGRGSWPLPKSSETVRAAGHNRGAIGAEGYGRDRPRMAERRSQRLTSFHVPDAGAAIYAARHEELTVRTKGRSADGTLMDQGGP